MEVTGIRAINEKNITNTENSNMTMPVATLSFFNSAIKKIHYFC